jgi:hypothetical protein
MTLSKKIVFFLIFIIGILMTYLGSEKGTTRVVLATFKYLSQHRIESKVTKVEGSLPTKIKLINFSSDYANADEVELEISILPLLFKKIELKNLVVKNLVLKNTQNKPLDNSNKVPTLPTKLPISLQIDRFKIYFQDDFICKGNLKLNQNLSGSSCVSVKDKSKSYKAKCLCHWDSTYNGDLVIKIDASKEIPIPSFLSPSNLRSIPALNLEGSFEGSIENFVGKLNIEINEIKSKIKIKKEKTQVSLPKIKITTDHLLFRGTGLLNENLLPQEIHGTVKSTIKNQPIEGIVDIKGVWELEKFIGESSLKVTLSNELCNIVSPIEFSRLNGLSLPSIKLQSKGLEANGNFSLDTLKFIPKSLFEIEFIDLQFLSKLFQISPAKGKGTGIISIENQKWNTSLTMEKVSTKWGSAEEVDFTLSPNLSTVEINRFQYKQIPIDSIFVNIENSKVDLKCLNKTKIPFELATNGNIDLQEKKIQINISNFVGHINHKPLNLTAPSNLILGNDNFIIAPTSFIYGEGKAFLSKTNEKMVFDLEKIPLDLLSLNSLDLPVEGEFSLSSSFHSLENFSIHLRTENGSVLNEEENTKLPFDVILIAKKNNVIDQFDLKVNCNEKDHYRLSWDNEKEEIQTIGIDAELGSLSHLIDLGSQSIEGKLECNLTKHRNSWKGNGFLRNGFYSNYATGTKIENIQAQFLGEADKILFKEISGDDGSNGKISIKGFMSNLENLNFEFKGVIDNFSALKSQIKDGVVDGSFSFKGTNQSALFEGEFLIDKLPEVVKMEIPELAVTYKYPQQTSILNTKQSQIYPIKLDITLKSKDQIEISGKGLESSWAGKFLVKGDLQDPIIEGSLNLKNGSFQFSGKQFHIKHGEILFRKDQPQVPWIDLVAEVEASNVIITAKLQGEVNSPELRFESNPPKPLASILSYLIFGKDMSEISPLQVLQIASTAASIAGEGPDLLELTKKTLGVDRLQILVDSDPSQDQESRVRLEVGKVIYPGFTLLIKQSAEESTPEVGVEIDLGKGFTLGLENQHVPDQGKISIKWNHSFD